MATNKNFNLYKVLQSTGLYTPINYGNLSVDTTPIQNAIQSVTNTMHSLGYKTKEEKQKEFEDKIKTMQERTAGLSDADSATDWYHAMETDPAKRAEWDRQAAAVTGYGIGAIATIASAGTMGWIPALVSTGTGYAGGYGGYKLGEAIDKRYGTNTAPWLSFAGGMLGGGLGYKGLLRTANKGWLGTSPYTYLQPEKQHLAYSPQFTKDVIDDIATTSLRSYVPTYGTVKYYGPTMGKTTAAKTNPNLIDFDDYVRPELEQLASELGMTRQQLMMSQDPTVREKARQLMLKSVDGWKRNPSSDGKTLVISKSDILQDPIFDNQPLVLQRPEFLKRNAARGETDLQNSMDWYASTRRKGGDKLMEWPDPEGVYISELEPFTPDPHRITFTPITKRGAYTWFEKPSKLTLAERLGIPKGDRANLTQDQLEGLEDLMHYNTNGKYRWHLTYNDKTGFARTTAANRPEGSIHGIQAMVNRGATQLGENGPMGIATKTGNWAIWPTRKNFPAKFSGGDFPTPEGMGWAPGDLSLMLDGNTGKGLKVIMTSPRVDLANSLDDVSPTLLESLPNTIDKNIMRRFWQNNDRIILPGSYLSGDNGTLPLGLNGISAIDQGKGMSGAISEILHPTHFRPHSYGLSPDSMLSILKQGQRPGHAVRYGPGFTQLNSSAVYNKHIYDAWSKYKAGAMSAGEFKTIFDDWFVSQGGRPLEIRTPNKFRWVRNNDGTKTLVQQEQTPYIVFPHPYVHYKKKGGKL